MTSVPLHRLETQIESWANVVNENRILAGFTAVNISSAIACVAGAITVPSFVPSLLIVTGCIGCIGCKLLVSKYGKRRDPVESNRKSLISNGYVSTRYGYVHEDYIPPHGAKDRRNPSLGSIERAYRCYQKRQLLLFESQCHPETLASDLARFDQIITSSYGHPDWRL